MSRFAVWLLDKDGAEFAPVGTRRNANHASILARKVARGEHRIKERAGGSRPRVGIYDNKERRWTTKDIVAEYDGGIEPAKE